MKFLTLTKADNETTMLINPLHVAEIKSENSKYRIPATAELKTHEKLLGTNDIEGWKVVESVVTGIKLSTGDYCEVTEPIYQIEKQLREVER